MREQCGLSKSIIPPRHDPASSSALILATRSSSPVAACCCCFDRIDRRPVADTLTVLSLLLEPCRICRSDLGTPRVFPPSLSFRIISDDRSQRLGYFFGEKEGAGFQAKTRKLGLGDVLTYLAQDLNDGLIGLAVLGLGGDAELDGVVGDLGDALADLARPGPHVAPQEQGLGRRLLDQVDGFAGRHGYYDCVLALNSFFFSFLGDLSWN